MRTLKLIVAYDGTNYHGFQRQENAITVQQILENRLTKLCNEKITLNGSGRTDTGVHACGQVVSFITNGTIPTENLLKALNGLLPDDIVISSAEEVSEEFHARFHACWKRYKYEILQNKIHDPFKRNYVWQINKQLDLVAMQKAAQLLVGTHDFTFFQSATSVKKSPIKTIYRAHWQQDGDKLEFCIEGNSFLYHMVRNIVWNLVAVGLGKKTIATFESELKNASTHSKYAPAPPQGLYLDYVSYEEYLL